MLLQPVAFAINRCSPKSWVNSFKYGVSPQPAQAPLNSKSGLRSWLVLTEAGSHMTGSTSIRSVNAFHASRSASRCAPMGFMLMLLRLTSVLSCAGQTVTQTPHPVQSSGATWIVSDIPGTSRLRNDFDFTGVGPVEDEPSGSYTFMRIAACGQTITHFPQSMHRSGSQIGISVAMHRFSICEVAVGKVPSGGNALTGSRSPWPASIVAVTRWTKSVVRPVVVGDRWLSDVTDSPIGTGKSCANVASIAVRLRWTITSPRFP